MTGDNRERTPAAAPREAQAAKSCGGQLPSRDPITLEL